MDTFAGAQHTFETHQQSIVTEAGARVMRRFGRTLSDLHARFVALDSRVYSLNRFGMVPVPEDEVSSSHATNWLAIPRARARREIERRIVRNLRAVGSLPMALSLNPLKRLPSPD